MSVILTKLRLLEAKRDSGALSDAEFARNKADLLDEVPEAFVEIEVTTKPEPSLWDMLWFWLIAAVVGAAITWVITGNIAIASTLGITALAAFTIKLFATLE